MQRTNPLAQLLAAYAPPRIRDPLVRDAFREHVLASIWNGISAGIVLLTDVILAKTLAAPGWQVTLLSTLAPASSLVSFYWTGQIHNRRKAGFFLLAGLLGRLPLALLLFYRTAAAFIFLNFLYAVANALVVVASNALLQGRYPEDERPRYFALATSAGTIAAIGAVQAAGFLLTRREDAFPWLFAAAGAAGLISTYHLFRMECRPGDSRSLLDWLIVGRESVRRRIMPLKGDAPPPGLSDSFRISRRIVAEHPEFMRFERNYMVYGFAFLSVVPILPLYVVKELRMDYSQLSSLKGILAQVGIVLLSPVLSVSLSRLQPFRFTGRIFLLLASYPLFLWISTLPGVAPRIPLVYLALFLFSIAMAGVNLSWSLGSMYFAGDQDAATFQGIHVTMTGIRGLLAPGLGFLVYKLAGSGAVFALSTVLFATAGVLMLRQEEAALAALPAGSARGERKEAG